MKYSVGAVALIIFATVISGYAQRRTITNADLEKYRLERVRAEREYMDTYQQLGRPSPEELRRQRDESLASTARVAEMLMNQQLEREQMEMQREEVYRSGRTRNPGYMDDYDSGVGPTFFYGGGYGFGSYGGYGSGRSRSRGRGGFGGSYQQPYYVGGGSIWPIGPATPSAPLFTGPRGPRGHR